MQLSQMTLQLTMAHPNLSLQQLISMAQNIIHTRQQQAEQQQQAAMASQLHSHPVFARLSPEQQRQLSTMQPHQIRQVCTLARAVSCAFMFWSRNAGSISDLYVLTISLSSKSPRSGRCVMAERRYSMPGVLK